MSKFVRTFGTALAVVGSIAATAATLGAAAPVLGLTLAQAGAIAGAAGGLLSTLAAKRPVSERQGQQLQFKIDPGAAIPYVVGRTMVGGTLVHRETYGTDNHYETFFTVLGGGGPYQAIEAFTADRVVVPFAGTKATGYYANWMWQDRQLGATPEADALTSGVVDPPYGVAGPVPGWGAAYKLSGYCAASWSLLFDTKARRYANGEPAGAWIVKGAKVYDPRLDSTYPGGVGACRWAPPSDAAAHAAARATWVYSETPALHGLMWRLGIWQRDETNPVAGYRKIMGIGAPIDLIDVAAIVASANVQETLGWTLGGQVDSAQGRWDVLKLMEQAGGADPVSSAARLSTMQRTPRVSLATITADDLADGKLSIPSNRPRRERLNGFRARFRSEVHGWELVPIDIVQVPAYVAADGGEKTGSDDFALVQDADQAACLAAYQVFDSREIEPIVLPLKPRWMGYRIGDAVTLDLPPFAGQLAIIKGRSIDPATCIVTMTFSTETTAKHAAALGQSAVVPPVPSFSLISDEVAAPDGGDWSLAGVTFSDNGVSIPALVATGVVGNTNADGVVFDFRPFVDGADPATGWSAASIDAPETVRKEFTGVTPGTQYEVGVRYRVRGAIGERLMLGPVTAGSFTIGVSSAIATSFPIGLALEAADDGTITISDHTRRYTDGHADVAVDGGVIASALVAGDFRAIGYDDLDRAGGAVIYQLFEDDIDARVSPANPGRHYVGFVTIPTVGSPPAGGGGATPPGGACVTTDTHVLLMDGTTKPAGSLAIGDWLKTRDELTLEWGNYPITAIAIVPEQPVLEVTIGGKALRGTPEHMVYVESGWTKLSDVEGAVPVGNANVVKMTVARAATYVSNGILSHNLKQISPVE